jgi:hypothetical protein
MLALSGLHPTVRIALTSALQETRSKARAPHMSQRPCVLRSLASLPTRGRPLTLLAWHRRDKSAWYSAVRMPASCRRALFIEVYKIRMSDISNIFLFLFETRVTPHIMLHTYKVRVPYIMRLRASTGTCFACWM